MPELIARARFKAVDQIAPEFVCCDSAVRFLEAHKEKTFDVHVGPGMAVKIRCATCHRLLEFHVVHIAGTERTKIALELIDIDEGSIHA